MSFRRLILCILLGAVCIAVVPPERIAVCAEDADELLAHARKLWEEKKYSESVDAYRKLRDNFPDHAFVKSGDARFWLCCSLGNAGKTPEEIEETKKFLKEYPNHGSCGYMQYFLGVAYRKVGDEAAARAAWEELLKKYPDDPMVEYAKIALSGESATATPEKRRNGELPLGSDFLDFAEGAARWLMAAAVEKDGAVIWPEYDKTRAKPVDFYNGSAGVALFFLNMSRLTAKPEYEKYARMTAQFLMKGAKEDQNGLCWKNESELRDGTLSRDVSPALYCGVAGIGSVFLSLHRAYKDPDFLKCARSAGDWIVATAENKGNCRSWGEATDIISGPAGIGLFLLQLHAATGEKKYLECAEGTGEWLLSQAVKDGDCLKWKSAASLDRFYTGFSHGTAGIAYYLARLYEVTRNAKLLEAAEAGAKWLVKNATADGAGVKWFHYEPDHKDNFQTGWCHGPAGTCRLFLELHRIAKRPEYLDTAKKGAAWLMSTLDPAKKDSPFYGMSMCCGTAGVGDFFIDLFLATGDDSNLEYAARIAEYVIRHAKSEKEGNCWTNCDAPDEEGKIYFGTGHMIGAAGVGSFLLRLYAVCNCKEGAFVSFADKPQAQEKQQGETKKASYVVMTNLDDKDPYHDAVTKLAAYRKATVLKFDLDKMIAARRRLAELQPRYVALVLKPQDIDVNLHRRMLALSTRMDDDPFCDFAFGFITGKAAADAGAMVTRTIETEKKGIPKTMIEASVISEGKSYTSDGIGIPLVTDLGYKGKQMCWACVEHDPKVGEFAKKNLKELQGYGVICFGGCGDPEGIWLFADERNMDSSKHWPFDPKKVGFDPKGEMPRVTAEQFQGLNFAPAVVWSGTCHSGVLHRAYVEGDIVSTFGTVEKVEEYIIPEGRSLCLAILSCGPTAFLAPIGANHGYACLVEMWRALATGLPLGEIMRTRYNEIILGAGNRLDITLYVKDGPMLAEDPMRGGGANRLMFGDPMYAPFPAAGKDYLAKKREPLTGKTGFLLECEVVDENSFVFWDMFGNDSNNPERVYTTVELPSGIASVSEVSATAKSPDGKDMAISKCTWGVEQIDGKRIVHLQANAPRDALGKKGTKVVFSVSGGR